MMISDGLFDDDFSRRKYVAHIAGKIFVESYSFAKTEPLIKPQDDGGCKKINNNNNNN